MIKKGASRGNDMWETYRAETRIEQNAVQATARVTCILSVAVKRLLMVDNHERSTSLYVVPVVSIEDSKIASQRVSYVLS
jgi:hypothetical protein